MTALTKYSLWGFATFLLGLAVLYALFDLMHFNYWIAVPVSVMTNLVAHYTASRLFVFTKTDRSVESGLIIFFLIGLAEIIFITGSVALLVEYTAGDVYWSRIGAGILAAIGGFYANAKYNFKAL